VEDSLTGGHFIRKTIGVVAGNYSWGAFVKSSGRQFVVLRNNAFGGIYKNACFNLNLGTVVFDGLGNAKIEKFGNGWFRITADSEETSVVARNYEIHISDVAVNDDSAISYTGDGTSGVFIWGAQLEEGPYPTSYIPTTASAVTRNQDVISASNIGSLLNDAEGGVYINASYFENKKLFSINKDGGEANRVQIGAAVQGRLQIAIVRDNNVVNIANSDGNNININNFFKIAGSYKSTGSSLFINSVKEGEFLDNSSFNQDTLNTLDFHRGLNTSPFFGRIRELIVFNNAPTDAELQTLTTP